METIKFYNTFKNKFFCHVPDILNKVLNYSKVQNTFINTKILF